MELRVSYLYACVPQASMLFETPVAMPLVFRVKLAPWYLVPGTCFAVEGDLRGSASCTFRFLPLFLLCVHTYCAYIDWYPYCVYCACCWNGNYCSTATPRLSTDVYTYEPRANTAAPANGALTCPLCFLP